MDYLVRKMGFYPDIPTEVSKATDILLKKEIISTYDDPSSGQKKISLWPHYCLMTQNITKRGYEECLERDPNLEKLL